MLPILTNELHLVFVSGRELRECCMPHNLYRRDYSEQQLREFGEHIKRLRNENGLTVREAGHKLDVSANFISQLERGVVKPTDEMIQKIAECYNVNEDSLYHKLGHIPKSALEALSQSPFMQKALSYLHKQNIEPERIRKLEDELRRVYQEHLENYSDDSI